jgi:hypothetical protein
VTGESTRVEADGPAGLRVAVRRGRGRPSPPVQRGWGRSLEMLAPVVGRTTRGRRW